MNSVYHFQTTLRYTHSLLGDKWHEDYTRHIRLKQKNIKNTNQDSSFQGEGGNSIFLLIIEFHENYLGEE